MRVIDVDDAAAWRLPRKHAEPSGNSPIGRLIAAIDDVVSEPLSPSSTGYGDDLRALYRCINRIEAEAARRLLPFDTNREFEAEKQWSTISFLRNECGHSHSAAVSRVEIARRVPDLPKTWDAFRQGDVGVRNAAGVAHLVAAVGSEAALVSDEVLATTSSDYRPESFR